MSYDTVAYWSKLGGTVFFTVAFTIALIYALWPKNKKRFDEAAKMPLTSDDNPKL